MAANCLSAQAYQAAYPSSLPADVGAACGNTTVVGFDAASAACWARLNRDDRIAVIARP